MGSHFHPTGARARIKPFKESTLILQVMEDSYISLTYINELLSWYKECTAFPSYFAHPKKRLSWIGARPWGLKRSCQSTVAPCDKNLLTHLYRTWRNCAKMTEKQLVNQPLLKVLNNVWWNQCYCFNIIDPIQYQRLLVTLLHIKTPSKALGSFVLWSLDSIFADLLT